MNINEHEDFWTQQTKADETQTEPHLKVHTIEEVVPLDEQFGVENLKTVPDMLRDTVLGQPQPTKIESQRTDEDAPQMSPAGTYAILDAAKIKNLPELLETSGLEHRCLFKGDAFDELKDVAPWIVRLENGNRFTRNLFTCSDAPWHLWDDQPGIYLRSHGTLNEMWGHFRKFTRVQDENGKWIYFRFWESGSLLELLQSWRDNSGKLASFFAASQPHSVLNVICLDHIDRSASVVALSDHTDRIGSNVQFSLNAADRHVLSSWRETRFDRMLLLELGGKYPDFARRPQASREAWLQSVIEAAERVEIKLEGALADFAHAAHLLGANPATHGETVHIVADKTFHQKDRARLARQAAQRYSKVRG
ncbi:MAG: hypothetical protein ACJA06_000894 [Halocynthiibacter sp.]